MTDKKDTNDFDFEDSNDFDFGDEVAANNEPPIAVVPETNDFDFDFDDDFGIGQPDKPALTRKELDYIKRGVFSKNFIFAMRAEKKKKDDQRLRDLEPMITFVKNYYEKIDELDWYEERFLADALDSYPNGNKKIGDIIYQLTSMIQGIAFSACENNHDNKIHGDDLINIKVLASFIVDLAEDRL